MFLFKSLLVQIMSLFFESNDDQNIKEVKIICSSNERQVYEKKSAFFVHNLFNGKTEWPTETTISCFYDEHQFTGIPIPLPLNYVHEQNKYSCYGIFCSASCVKAYLENNSSYSKTLSIMWLKKIMHEVFNDYSDIVAAPPKDLLKKYGGELTIDEFRSAGKQHTSIRIHKLPFFTCSLAFEIVKNLGDDKGFIHPDNVKSNEKNNLTVKKLKRSINKTFTDLSAHASSSCFSSSALTSSSSIDYVPPPPPYPPPPNQIDENVNDLQTSDSLTNILEKNFIIVPADAGNKWGIRDLKKPTNLQSETSMSSQEKGKSMFQEYLESKALNNSITLPSPHDGTIISVVTPPSTKDNTIIDVNTFDLLKTKKRGRPKVQLHPHHNTATNNHNKKSNNNNTENVLGPLAAFLKK